jgi:hypothetical protein
MFQEKHYLMVRCFTLALALGVTSMMMGCSQSPISSQDDVVAKSSSQGMQATKPAWGTGGTVIKSSTTTISDANTVLKVGSKSDYYYPNSGCYINLVLKKYGTDADVVVKEAYFAAGFKSLVGGEQLVRIDMTVMSGTTLNDIDVVFGPSGLAFLPEATLTLKLAGPVTPDDVMAIGHFGGDDTYIESIETEVTKRGQSFIIAKVKVPGFSRYSLGGDR